jgi:hypothetical protein
MLRATERVDVPVAQLRSIGEADLDRTQLTQLRDFVIARNVVSVPSDQLSR